MSHLVPITQVVVLKPHPEKDYINVSTRILESCPGEMLGKDGQQIVYKNAEKLAADPTLFATWK